MTKTFLIFIAIIVIIVGGYFWLSASPSTSTPVSTTVPSLVTNTNSGTTGDTTSGSSSSTTATNQSQDISATPGSFNEGSIIDPGSGAAQIVGSNLMLGVDQNSQLGNYLIGYTGMTLYSYEKDTGASSTCYAQCAQEWPPYIVSPSDSINTQYGVNQNDVSIITRADGTLQVAYNGHPLYFYSGDTQETTNGQGFGGVWYVVKP